MSLFRSLKYITNVTESKSIQIMKIARDLRFLVAIANSVNSFFKINWASTSGLRHLVLAFFFSRALASGVIHGGSRVDCIRTGLAGKLCLIRSWSVEVLEVLHET